jgi:hypothetical protein
MRGLFCKYLPPNHVFPSSAPQHHCAFDTWLSREIQISCSASSAATASKTLPEVSLCELSTTQSIFDKPRAVSCLP